MKVKGVTAHPMCGSASRTWPSQLDAEWRLVLELLAACRELCTEAMMLVHGFTVREREVPDR